MEQDQDYGQNLLEQSTNSNLNSLLSKTFVDYSQLTPKMVWNTTKKTWDNWQGESLLEQWEPFLATWPTSGMTHDGQVFELPIPAHHTTGSESSLLPTPTTIDAKNVDVANQMATRKSPGLQSITGLLPTPVVNDMGAGKTVDHWDEWTEKTKEKHQNGNGHGPSLNIEMLRLVPEVLVGMEWGKFEPAIRRWETVLGRPAPAPTKPDGKDGNHRLSSKFTEWMMGLPEGWITNIGLTRNQELKACGNGVVPQQAELALRILLGIK